MTARSSNSNESVWILCILSAVVFFAVVNGTMINVALPIIGQDFGVSEGTYGWIVTGFSLAFGIFNAVHGRLSDIFGVRRLYLAGIVVMGVTSVMLAMAPTVEITIGLRVVQGIGSAALPVLGSTIIVRTFPIARRGAAMGIILGVVGVGASLGPFLGGLLVQVAGWRAVFLFTAAVLMAVPVGLRFLPKSLDERTPQRFDVLGSVLLGLGVTGLLYSSTVLEQYGLGAEFVGLIVGSLAILVVFGWWISRTEQPFVDPELFHDIRYVAMTAVAFLSNATRFGTIVLVPIFLIEVNGLEPIWVGAVLLPGAICIAVFSVYAGRLADKIGARRPVAAGMLLIVAGNLVTAFVAGGSPIWVSAGMGLYGLGFALIQSPLISTTSSILSARHTGVGLGIFMMIFFLGGAFGVALSVTTLELQAAGTASWIGLELGAGARFSNAILTLTGLALLGLTLLGWVPTHGARPREQHQVGV